jgi:asparagine synthase (glutamine-hydrolysing)
MCAIVGLVAFDPLAVQAPERVIAMRDVMAHRGPDGEGVWIDGPVALGHRRLAIVDVSGGRQPMSNEDGTVWLVFNGEIYNHARLRDDLIRRGHRYRTRSDTETIVHLYEEYGDAFVERLEGMFGFALWDARRRRLVAARDRLGIKPLYYTTAGGELALASEIKAFVAGGWRPRFNQSVLPEFLANRYVAGTETFFQDVRRVPPGHLLTWSPETGVVVTRYWQVPMPPADDEAGSMEEEAVALRQALGEAVRRHLMSDVPLGVFLSGGIDSSAIAALAARFLNGPLQTFSVGFREASADELPYARMVARAIGAHHHELRVTPDAFAEALPELVWCQDEPLAFTSNVPLYFVSRLAERHVKVVLTGEGADELFLGYNRYRVTLWNERLGGLLGAALPPRARRAVRALTRRLPAAARRYLSRSFLALDPTSRALFFDNFAVFPERRLQGLLAAPTLDRDPYAYGLRCYGEAGGGCLDRMSAADLQTYLCELLMKQDRMSMAASIESRVPFLDDQLVARVARLPSRLKLRGWRTKAVLRRAVSGLLPPEILTRRKMGFPVPFGDWLRDGFRPLVDEFVLSGRALDRGWLRPEGVRTLVEEHRRGRAAHGERLWLLINLELWQRIFCDGERPGDVLGPVRRRQGRTHANPVGQDGRSVAARHGRTAADLPDRVGVVARS